MQNFYFTRRLPELEDETKGGKDPPTTPGGTVGPWLCHHMVYGLGHPLATPSRLLNPLDLKTSGESPLFMKPLRNSAAIVNPLPGVRNSVLAPYRDEDLEEIVAIIITNAYPSTIDASPIHE